MMILAIAGSISAGCGSRVLTEEAYRKATVSAGDGHTCAILADAKVRCWGRGNLGRLGYASEDHIGDDETPASAGDVQL